MNLQQIITENINKAILDKIISEEILREVAQQNATATQIQQPAQGQNQQQTVQPTQQGQNWQQTATDYTQYANKLYSIVGANGIDARPVQNNQQAVQHIQKLNKFVFEVINAIESGNIIQSNGGVNAVYKNPYDKTKAEYAMDASKGIVNFLGNGTENVVGYGNNNPFKGVIKAGLNTYNKDHNAIASMMQNRKLADARKNRSNGGGMALDDLMTRVENGCFPVLDDEYNTINSQNNGIFNSVPAVSNCYSVLMEIHRKVNTDSLIRAMQQNGGQQQGQTPQQQQAQTQQQQQQPQQQTATNQSNQTGQQNRTSQPTGVRNTGVKNTAPNPSKTQKKTQINYKRYLLRLRNVNTNGNRLNKYMEKIERLPDIDEKTRNDLKTILDRSWDLCDACITSIESNSIYSGKPVNGVIPLQDLMSLNKSTMGESKYFYDVYESYNMYNQYYGGSIDNEFPALASMMQVLRELYTEMKKSGMSEASSSTPSSRPTVRNRGGNRQKTVMPRRGGYTTPANGRNTILRRR